MLYELLVKVFSEFLNFVIESKVRKHISFSETSIGSWKILRKLNLIWVVVH